MAVVQRARNLVEHLADKAREKASQLGDAAKRLKTRAGEWLFGKDIPTEDAPGRPGPGYGRMSAPEELSVATRRVLNVPIGLASLGAYPHVAGKGLLAQPELIDPTASSLEAVPRIGAPHVAGLRTILHDIAQRDPQTAQRVMARLIDQPEMRSGLEQAQVANVLRSLGLMAGSAAAGAGAGVAAGLPVAAESARALTGLAAGAGAAPIVARSMARHQAGTGMAGARSAFLSGLGAEGKTPGALSRFLDPTSAAVQRAARAVTIHDPGLAEHVRSLLTGTRQLGVLERIRKGVSAGREAFKQKIASLPLPDRWVYELAAKTIKR